MSLGGKGGTRLESSPSTISTFSASGRETVLAELRALTLTPSQKAELTSLEREGDPELFYRDLLNFGILQEQNQKLALATKVFQLVGTGPVAALRKPAQEYLSALLGKGTLGQRTEVLLRRLTQETLDPSTLFAMGAASALFKLTRLATLGKLLSSPQGLFTRGLGARSTAALAGFAVEAPVFTFSGKLAREALVGPQNWNRNDLGNELASSYLVLGGLKIGAFGSGFAYRGLVGRIGTPQTLPSLTQHLVQQGGALAGILLGHALEQGAGLRAQQDGTATLMDSLVFLLQAHVAGKLSSSAFGKNFEAWQQRLELQTQLLQANPLPLTSGLAMAVAGGPKDLGYPLPMASNAERVEPVPTPSPTPVSAVRARQLPRSDPPPDEGMLGRDAVRWCATQSRGPEDVQLVSDLAGKIRSEMWRALNLQIEGPLARAIALGLPLIVRLLPVDGSLENYQLELHPRGLAPQGDAFEVRFQLDSAEGHLRLLDYLPNAAWELHRSQDQAPPMRGFIPFYRSLADFRSDALRSDPLLETLPPEMKEYVLMDPTQNPQASPLPPLVNEIPSPSAAEAPPPSPAKSSATLLTQYFPRIEAGLKVGVARYLDIMMITGEKQRLRLHRLVDRILVALRDRETENPLLAKQASLQVWIRPTEPGGKKRQIEILTAAEALKRHLESPPGDGDVMLSLYRYPGVMGNEGPVLEHQYLRTNPKDPSIPDGADLEFQRDLGLGDFLRLSLPVDDLHLTPPDLGSWEAWMQQYGFRPGSSDGP